MKIKSILITVLIVLFSCGQEVEEVIPEITVAPEPEKIKFKNYRREVMNLREKRNNNEEKMDFQDASRYILKTYDEWKEENK